MIIGLDEIVNSPSQKFQLLKLTVDFKNRRKRGKKPTVENNSKTKKKKFFWANKKFQVLMLINEMNYSILFFHTYKTTVSSKVTRESLAATAHVN